MDIDIIRLFGAAYIMESDISPEEKHKLIDYVKEADWDQILNLVFNGRPPDRKLTINEQYILEAQAENYIYPMILKYLISEKEKPWTKDAGQIYTQTKDWAKRQGKKGAKAYEKHKGTVLKHTKRVGYVILIAAVTAAAHRSYKMYLTKAARACKGKKGTDKRDCMVKFQKAAYQAKINAYAKARGDCGKTSNPEKCKRKLDTKIKKVKYRLSSW